MNGLLNKWFKKEKKLKLEFCQNNLDQFLDGESFRLFEEFFSKEKVSMKEYKCLSHCELCKERPFIKANGETISADNPLGLLNKLKQTH